MVVVTANKGDFEQLHSRLTGRGQPHAGIVIFVQQAYSEAERARRLIFLAQVAEPDQMANRVEYLSNWRP